MVKVNIAMFAILLFVGILFFTEADAHVTILGVCYGTDGDNLPSAQEVVDLYKSNGFGNMRLYYPDERVLQALKGSEIEVILDVPNHKLRSLANAEAATDWVNTHVKAYISDVKLKYIVVGNEVEPSDPDAKYVLPVMKNIQKTISMEANKQGDIKVSTAIKPTLLAKTYPPNDGVFRHSASPYINPIVNFLKTNKSPLLVNVFPYFSYVDNKEKTSLDYALFAQQGTNEAGYQNLFDETVDAVYAALEKVGAPKVRIVVSASGWPSEGGDAATVQNAEIYYQNLVNHIKGGTPKRPNEPIETCLYEMFDENKKDGPETAKHFGIFNPDKSPKYQLSFNI